MKESSSYQIIFFLFGILFLHSCSGGYNKYADTHYEQGLIFYETMEYNRSIESFTKVLELAPYGEENNKVYYNRGQAYFRTRQYDKAIYDFTKSLELTSKKEMQFTLYRARGNAWLAEEEYNNAIEDYSNALSLLPKHADAKYVYDSRAWALTKSEQYDEAIEDFSEAIRIDSEFARSYYGRGYVWHKKGDFHRALNDAKEAHKLKPEVKNYDDLMYEVRSSMKNE